MKLRFLVAAVLAALCSKNAFAQDPAPPVPSPPPAWTGSLGAGLAITTGNTDTLGFNMALNAKYAPGGPQTFKLDALYIYQRANGDATADKANALARYEYALSKDLFAFGQVGYLRDKFKNVTYLVSPLVGAGYKFLNDPRTVLAADVSIGAAFEGNGDAGTDSSGAFQFGQNFSHKISPTATVTERFAALFKTKRVSDYNLHFEAGIATAITRQSELKATYLVDYKNEPVGIDVKKTDTSFILAVVLKV